MNKKQIWHFLITLLLALATVCRLLACTARRKSRRTKPYFVAAAAPCMRKWKQREVEIYIQFSSKWYNPTTSSRNIIIALQPTRIQHKAGRQAGWIWNLEPILASPHVFWQTRLALDFFSSQALNGLLYLATESGQETEPKGWQTESRNRAAPSLWLERTISPLQIPNSTNLIQNFLLPNYKLPICFVFPLKFSPLPSTI